MKKTTTAKRLERSSPPSSVSAAGYATITMSAVDVRRARAAGRVAQEMAKFARANGAPIDFTGDTDDDLMDVQGDIAVTADGLGNLHIRWPKDQTRKPRNIEVEPRG